MRDYNLIREWKLRNFTVCVRAEEDNDLDLSWDEDGSVRAGLESGKFMAFGVVVTVYCRGSEVGQDSLWNCIYESPRAFMDHLGIKQHNRQTGHNCGSYFSGMVREAISEARKAVADFKRVHVRV